MHFMKFCLQFFLKKVQASYVITKHKVSVLVNASVQVWSNMDLKIIFRHWEKEIIQKCVNNISKVCQQHTSIIVMKESESERGPTDAAETFKVNLDDKSSRYNVSTCKLKDSHFMTKKWTASGLYSIECWYHITLHVNVRVL